MNEFTHLSNKYQSIRTIKSFSFFQNTEYIINDSFGSKVFYNDKILFFKERALYVMDYLCRLKLTSLKSYNEGVRNISNYKYNIPIYLNEEQIFIAISNIKEFENIWINYAKISNIEAYEEETIINFKSGNQIKIAKNPVFFNKQFEKINKIKKYLQKWNK